MHPKGRIDTGGYFTLLPGRRPSAEDYIMEINENLWATKPVISPHARLLSRGSLWNVRYIASSSESLF